MENTPLPPRTRNRRTERYAAQHEEPQELRLQPEEPSAPPPTGASVHSMQQPVQAWPRQPSQPAAPAPMQTLPPSQALYRQAMQQQRHEQAAQPRYVPREAAGQMRPAAHPTPRALQQRPDPQWRTPSVEPRPAAAPDRAGQHPPIRKQEAPAREKKSPAVPGWLSTLLCLSLVCVMALVAGMWLIRAWLRTDLDQRTAAYRAILNNYHVTEDASGKRSVTYQAWIERYAREYNLQPAFVTAIIRNESSFRTNAESNVGARGLMQMMPDTSEWIAGKLDDDSYSFDRMYDAETNIRYGCWYLGYLSSEFRGDPILIAAAYHAGQGNVRGWLGNRDISPDGLTIPMDKLPIAETRQYAGRVTQAYGIYQSLLYTPDAPPAVQHYDRRSAADQLLSAVR